MHKLLVATGNKHKLEEFQHMLRDLNDVEWVTLWDIGLGDMDVDETGTTFAENARLKAYEYQRVSGLITFADDSGLIVDALDGAPGIYSKRYGAPEAKTDVDRYELLLNNLKDVPEAQRTARFMATIAIALPGVPMNDIPVVEGTIEGSIGYEARGEYGFGYDPVFQLPDGRMLAEITPDEKNEISHRANALRNALPVIRELLETQ